MIASRAQSHVLALVAVAALSACVTGHAATAPDAGPPLPAVPPPSSAAAVAQARRDSLRAPYSAADIKFMTHMISHHAQAIVMAHWAPTHGASSAIRTLCGRIISAQRDEIVAMQTWLSDRRLPVPEANPKGMRMTMNGMEHEMLMPGMLTDAQMKELDAARGSEFDRLFLKYMIQHHKGAISMVEELFGSFGAGQDEIVFKFASDVSADQNTEIDRMELMLSEMSPASTTSKPRL